MAVPRVWEKMQEKMQEAARKNSPVKRAVANWAKAQATRHHEAVRRGVDDNSLGYRIAKKLVFNKVHQALGLGRVGMEPGRTYVGGAPLSLPTFEYFQSLDLVLHDLYGSTEATGPQTTNLPGMGCSPIQWQRKFVVMTL